MILKIRTKNSTRFDKAGEGEGGESEERRGGCKSFINNGICMMIRIWNEISINSRSCVQNIPSILFIEVTIHRRSEDIRP